MEQTQNPFRVEQEGPFAWLILNRPGKRNSMGFEFYEGLAQHFTAFDKDQQIRVVVIRVWSMSARKMLLPFPRKT